MKLLSNLKELFNKKMDNNFIEIENKYITKITKRGSVLLLYIDDAIKLLEECEKRKLGFSGVEAFRIIEEKIQPSMEFSNISFGQTAVVDGKIKLLSFERKIKKEWEEIVNVYEKTKEMMIRGAKNGYDYYEVTIEDKRTGALMFFKENYWNKRE